MPKNANMYLGPPNVGCFDKIRVSTKNEPILNFSTIYCTKSKLKKGISYEKCLLMYLGPYGACCFG